ncbi:winged helix-turn-helix domain-containing protein [Enterococcus caccae]|uniref:OmpR/PhoB-type domain-containing protein n=1 Tax=Enterococcus caccae ATCC BAA-1240 TaxID=1158612 RepID=R3X7M7_9ENTE|nr:winged helix-turn-helix domain-containing protein [Enterococcus caccae]EOL50080.1 hypothetical protein UC7_00499 [Enterococcus caccae ATCC BAA-1240]EOT56174.1 hypothetical protein I580_02974 [Enterococcus caccae ATCC BAA-1240]
MFNIALVNNVESSKLEYITALKEKKCSIHQIDPTEIRERIPKMDAVIVIESAVENIGLTCEFIIKVRDLTEGFVWVLSSESSKVNRIVHLQLGADGTFDNRIDSDEFCLYVMNTLERRLGKKGQKNSYSQIESPKKEQQIQNIRLVPANFSVNIEGKGEVGLTKLEFKALETLIRNKGEAISYEELYKSVWGKEKGDKKYRVANLIFHLRKKLEDDSFKPKYIRTVRSRGYMLSK